MASRYTLEDDCCYLKSRIVTVIDIICSRPSMRKRKQEGNTSEALKRQSRRSHVHVLKIARQPATNHFFYRLLISHCSPPRMYFFINTLSKYKCHVYLNEASRMAFPRSFHRVQLVYSHRLSRHNLIDNRLPFLSISKTLPPCRLPKLSFRSAQSHHEASTPPLPSSESSYPSTFPMLCTPVRSGRRFCPLHPELGT